MHNKLMVVDNVIALLGGRNIGDQYFQVDLDSRSAMTTSLPRVRSSNGSPRPSTSSGTAPSQSRSRDLQMENNRAPHWPGRYRGDPDDSEQAEARLDADPKQSS
jgi:hypothetical protein